jgi:hypothetical protein
MLKFHEGKYRVTAISGRGESCWYHLTQLSDAFAGAMVKGTKGKIMLGTCFGKDKALFEPIPR